MRGTRGKYTIIIVILVAALAALAYLATRPQGPEGEARSLRDLLAGVQRGERFSLTVSGKTSGRIDAKYTCDGEDKSPPVSWTGTPEGTEALALIVYDPDAPRGIFVHWVVYNIPPQRGGLEEGFPKEGEVGGILQGLNDFGKTGYGGPCPPYGEHRYVFLALALDKRLEPRPGMTAAQLLSRARGHVLGYGKAVLTYRRG